MTTVLAFPRSLPLLVTDLATTRQRFAAFQAGITGRDPTRDEEDAWSAFERREDALRAEIGQMVFAQTGVSADVLTAVLS